ncbi:MAG: low molecular weight protein-tyrosine-phosphatase [Bradymonadia bacterium]
MGDELVKRVLFVCLGNICRSPLGEGIFRHLVEARGLSDAFEIDSAGTGGWHAGELPDPRSIEVARSHGIDLTAQRARKFLPADLNRFDVVMAMDHSNLRDIRARAPQGATAEVGLLLDELSDPPTREVPDPYYGGPNGFEHVYQLVYGACEVLLDRLDEGRP